MSTQYKQPNALKEAYWSVISHLSFYNIPLLTFKHDNIIQISIAHKH